MAHPTRLAAPNEPLHIFQDDFAENQPRMINHAPMPPSAPKNRRPLGDSSTNVVLNPPTNGSGAAPVSPHKPRAPTSTAPLSDIKPPNGSKLQMITMAPPSGKPPKNTDSLQKKPFLSKFKTVAQKPSIDVMNFEKENVHPTIFPAPGPINFSLDNYCPQKPPGKRALMDAPTIKDSRPTKKQKTGDDSQQSADIPPHDSFPPIVDDGTKPGHSYATLIGMAILRSPHRRLTLSQIYKWISDTYSFYNVNDAGWQNSIRHNLSLHKAFYKMERPKDDPGKGNYWCIEPGMEQQFIKEKPPRKPATSSAAETVMSTRPEPPQHIQPPSSEPMLPPNPPAAPQALQTSLPPLPTSQATIPAPDLSSDATIPISDAPVPEEHVEKPSEADAAPENLYSPLQPAMHSSPPIPRHVEVGSGTPPPVSRALGSSISRSHKRKFASMDDSGYISSLESSVMRQKPGLLTSEADRPRIKRGRAEEEIARLRASSYDSPSKGRSWNNFAPQSSSPLRNDSTQMLPPLTPATKLKPPTRPPPSVSPNTNLRIHRDKVQSMLLSPLRKVGGVWDENNLSWSPAFQLDDSIFNCDTAFPDNTELDIFQDNNDVFADLVNFEHGSPIKRSVKRARLDRSQSTSALADITGSGSNRGGHEVPTFKIWDDNSAPLDSPSRAFEDLIGSPSKLFIQSPIHQASPSKAPSQAGSGLQTIPPVGPWPALTFDPSDLYLDPTTDVSGLDIMKGFERIGSGTNTQQPQHQHPPMPRNRGNKLGLSRYHSAL